MRSKQRKKIIAFAATLMAIAIYLLGRHWLQPPLKEFDIIACWVIIVIGILLSIGKDDI